MATQQEKNAVLELVNLAMEINSVGKVSGAGMWLGVLLAIGVTIYLR